MMTTPHPNTLKSHYKIQASILLKKVKIISQRALRSKNKELTDNLVARLEKLPHFAGVSHEAILNGLDTIQLKHCLNIIAMENGHLNWQSFLDEHNTLSDTTAHYDEDDYELYRYNLSEGALNTWYNNYEEAKIHLDRSGGYLLTYRHQYFICQAQHIAGLGVDPSDKDWDLIGRNWPRPNDVDAKMRLIEKLKKAQASE